MPRLSFIVGLMPLVALLGACVPVAEAPPDDAFHAERIEVRHQAILADGGAALAPGEDAALATFLAHNGASDAAIRVDATGPSAAAAQATMLRAVKRTGAIAVPGDLAAGPIDQAVVIVARKAYVSAACAVDAAPMLGGLRPAGCSNALNLRAMVDAPGDLVHGRAPGPAPAGPIGHAALRYLKDGGEATMSPDAAANLATNTSQTAAPTTPH
ncbi:MAG TPA: hypothetical protein VGV37_15985 [Aliidongia sp.]|uniref:hypothetical protein n=1 Tax=Aliidongia sp. TaxID=1914230 RepID=UPI002DDD5700|nr:hypothetical protein [Aliidongia sp.]HEV2676023.1 hypothetical protein [Aliidongia sp.]